MQPSRTEREREMGCVCVGGCWRGCVWVYGCVFSCLRLLLPVLVPVVYPVPCPVPCLPVSALCPVSVLCLPRVCPACVPYPGLQRWCPGLSAPSRPRWGSLGIALGSWGSGAGAGWPVPVFCAVHMLTGEARTVPLFSLPDPVPGWFEGVVARSWGAPQWPPVSLCVVATALASGGRADVAPVWDSCCFMVLVCWV